MKKYFIIKSKYPGNDGKIKNIYYYVSLQKGKNDYTLNVGNPKKSPCVIITIDKNQMATIQSVSFDEKRECSLLHTKYSKSVIRNVLKCSLLLAIKIFKNIDIFSLTDNSMIECGPDKISLSDYYYIKYGKSWYQFHFDAKPKYKNEIKNKIYIFKRLMKKKMKNNSKEKIIKYCSKYYDNIEEIIKFINKYYYENITFGEFIKSLMNDETDCAIYSYIFIKIFGNVLYGSGWKISKKSIKKYKDDIYFSIKTIEEIKSNKNINKFIKLVNNVNKMNNNVWKRNSPHFSNESRET
jgi:hypothetical protein